MLDTVVSQSTYSQTSGLRVLERLYKFLIILSDECRELMSLQSKCRPCFRLETEKFGFGVEYGRKLDRSEWCLHVVCLQEERIHMRCTVLCEETPSVPSESSRPWYRLDNQSEPTKVSKSISPCHAIAIWWKSTGWCALHSVGAADEVVVAGYSGTCRSFALCSVYTASMTPEAPLARDQTLWQLRFLSDLVDFKPSRTQFSRETDLHSSRILVCTITYLWVHKLTYALFTNKHRHIHSWISTRTNRFLQIDKHVYPRIPHEHVHIHTYTYTHIHTHRTTTYSHHHTVLHWDGPTLNT
jgi:hypothetical protein